jgi:hypothetical protein
MLYAESKTHICFAGIELAGRAGSSGRAGGSLLSWLHTRSRRLSSPRSDTSGGLFSVPMGWSSRLVSPRPPGWTLLRAAFREVRSLRWAVLHRSYPRSTDGVGACLPLSYALHASRVSHPGAQRSPTVPPLRDSARLLEPALRAASAAGAVRTARPLRSCYNGAGIPHDLVNPRTHAQAAAEAISAIPTPALPRCRQFPLSEPLPGKGR